MPKQYLDRFMPWCSRHYRGWFSVYSICLRYFKVSVCMCHNRIPLYLNLQLMTTGVKPLLKSLNNIMARQNLKSQIDLPNLSNPSKPCKNFYVNTEMKYYILPWAVMPAKLATGLLTDGQQMNICYLYLSNFIRCKTAI